MALIITMIGVGTITKWLMDWFERMEYSAKKRGRRCISA